MQTKVLYVTETFFITMRKKFLLILISCILYLIFCLNLFLSYENITEYGRFPGLVRAAVYYPSDDKSCISDGLNWGNGGNCTDIFVISPYSPNVWTVYAGQDVLVWNDEA